MCVRPLHNRLEAIQRLLPPTTIKGCRSFAGMVNFLSIFCPDLQNLLKLILDLTRKDRQFIWGQEQQTAFDEIKSRLQMAVVAVGEAGAGCGGFVPGHMNVMAKFILTTASFSLEGRPRMAGPGVSVTYQYVFTLWG